MTTVCAYHDESPGTPLDQQCEAIFDKYGCEFVGCGTYMGDKGIERDWQFDAPPYVLTSLRKELEDAGLRVEVQDERQ